MITEEAKITQISDNIFLVWFLIEHLFEFFPCSSVCCIIHGLGVIVPKDFANRICKNESLSVFVINCSTLNGHVI